MSIPKKIFQSWKTKDLKGGMKSASETIQKLNPEYTYYLYDDKDCREYILKYFGENYAKAFEIIKPGAFKCDFWRYAILYNEGGVYLDIDMIPKVPFRDFIRDDNRFISVVDRKLIGLQPCAIYQAFIACEPKHPILKYVLELTFNNIVTRKVDILYETLNISGPVTMGIAVNLFWNNYETYKNIVPGKYSDGVKLLRTDNRCNILDIDNRFLIQNKYDDYSVNPFNSYSVIEPYSSDPRRIYRKIVTFTFYTIILVCITAIICTFIYRKKWKNCEKSCSIRK